MLQVFWIRSKTLLYRLVESRPVQVGKLTRTLGDLNDSHDVAYCESLYLLISKEVKCFIDHCEELDGLGDLNMINCH